MAHTSTSIEGNILKEYQVAQVLQGEKVYAQERQIKEVKNYLVGLKEIDRLTESKNEFTPTDIRKIHKVIIDGLVAKEKTGVWRPRQVYIVNVLPNKTEELAYTSPHAKDVPKLIDELLVWLKKNTQIHPVIKTGLFHYQFETIHPFTDGNGRTGRLLSLLYLYQSGWDFKKILVLEDYYNNNRKQYYEALQTDTTYKTRQTADLSNWLEYFVEGFLDEAQKVKDQILSLAGVSDINATRNILDKDELKIVDFTITMGQITSADVVAILDIPKRTAQAKLKGLEDIKILEKAGAGPSTYYVVPKITSPKAS